MRMKKKYVWKQLTPEGRLLNTDEQGTYWSTFGLDGRTVCYNTLEEADAAYSEHQESHLGQCDTGDYVLVTVFTPWEES